MSSKVRLSSLLRGSAIGLAAAFALSSCSGPTGSEGAKTAAASKVAEVAEPASSGAEPRLRLITRDQYLNTLAYVFGADVRPDVEFAPVERVDGLLRLGTSRAGVNDTQLELYQKTAQFVAAQVIEPTRRNFVITCQPANEKAADAACATQVLNRVGRLMFRKPLEKDKLAGLVSHANASADRLGDFYAGLAVAIEEILMSPKAMLIAETAEPDPKNPGHMRLDAYSLASRLSYFLWDAAPDEALLKAAESGEIQTEKGRARIVDMMIASPRLKDGLRAFFDDMYDFEKMTTLAKDALVYPAFTGLTAEDAREQTLRTVVDHLITKKGDYRDLYTTRTTFLSPPLAALYQLPTTKGWIEYKFPDSSPRAGVLTHISFLASHSHPGRSSPTLRGKALRELLLCQPVPRPPANVDFSALENPKAEQKTQRDRVNFHLENPVCAGCHRITDPIGLAMENFDGSGRYRTSERGATIDASGNLDGKQYKDVTGLAAALHDHPGLTSCLVKRVYAYGTGSQTTNDDAEMLKFLNARFESAGYRVPDLLRTVALSKSFSEFKEAAPAAAEAKTASAAPATH
ncbi:MAG: DUF1592 domain-containing protein [Rhodospirillaceae bacterium]